MATMTEQLTKYLTDAHSIDALEHLEIGGYEQLRRVAERAGETDVARAAERILEQERAAAERIVSVFDQAVTESLEETVGR